MNISDFFKRTTKQPKKKQVITSPLAIKNMGEKPTTTKGGKRLSSQIKQDEDVGRTEMQFEELRDAIEAAEDTTDPDRTDLLVIYRQTRRDSQVFTQTRNFINKGKGHPFGLFKDGKDDQMDEEATKLFKTPWFNKYRQYFWESDLYGTSLVEFDPLMLDGQFQDVTLIPRYNVLPTKGVVKLELGGTKKLNYRKPPFSNWLIEIGNPNNLGLLLIAAEEVIYKKYAREDWSRLGEKNDPLLSITTSAEGEELDEIQTMAGNFGSDAFMIGKEGDKIEIVDRVKANAHLLHKDKVYYVDEQISKLFAGAVLGEKTGGSHAKEEVGMEMMDELVEAILREEMYHINFVLIPFLIRHGYPLEGLEYKPLAFVKEEEDAAAESEEDTPPNDDGDDPNASYGNFTKPLSKPRDKGSIEAKAVIKKKYGASIHLSKPKRKVSKPIDRKNTTIDNKQNANVNLSKQKSTVSKPNDRENIANDSPMRFIDRVTHHYQKHTCCSDTSIDTLSKPNVSLSKAIDSVSNRNDSIGYGIDLSDHLRRAYKRIYDNKLRAGKVDESIFLATADKLMEGVDTGYRDAAKKIKYGDVHHQALIELRHNAATFDLFKNHHHTNEVIQLLIGPDGKKRSFQEFRKEALKISTRYNEHHLRAEYNTANNAARNKAKFTQILEEGFSAMEYFIVNDDNNTKICEELNGQIFDIDDPELDEAFPPNHFECRSTVRGTDKKPKKRKTKSKPAKGFRKHFGKSGQIFDKSNPYLTVAPEFKKEAKELFGMAELLPVSLPKLKDNIRIIGKLDQKDFKASYFIESGGAVMEHTAAHTKDLKTNQRVATLIAQVKGEVVQINQHLENAGKNPELTIGKVLSDIKTPLQVKAKNIKGSFNLARKQRIENFVLELTAKPAAVNLVEGCKDGFFFNDTIKEVLMVYKTKLLTITRKEYEEEVMGNKIEKWLTE